MTSRKEVEGVGLLWHKGISVTGGEEVETFQIFVMSLKAGKNILSQTISY